MSPLPVRPAGLRTVPAARRLLLAALLIAGPAAAQPQTPAAAPAPAEPVTRTVALRNARIVQAPGRVIPRGTVVVRDGLILAAGADAAVPFDARIIEADSLVVYAGFVDGLSHAGLERPRDESPPPRVPRPGDPPNERAGIQPERDVRTLLRATHGSVDSLRRAGFTAAHVVPYGRLLPGSGALVLLAGEAPEEMVLRGDVSLFAQFQGGRGVYPNTPMGIMAKWRQLYRESARRREAAARYARDPAGLERPRYDAVHEALYPVVAGEKPVFFRTESALQARQALRLQRDLGFPIVLAGLKEGADLAPLLRARNLPVFVSLDLPDERAAAADSAARPAGEPDTLKAMTPPAPSDFFISDRRTFTYEDVQDERQRMEARQAESRRAYYANAARLHEAGVRFGFATAGAELKSLRRNLRLVVEHGLPEEAALAALTVDAARLLGLERSLGTVEPGKLANLVVTDGPLFAEETEVRYVFVEGRAYEYQPEPAPGSDAAPGGEPAASVAGSWRYTVTMPDGPVDGTFVLVSRDGRLGGTLTSRMTQGTAELEDVRFEGGRLSFQVRVVVDGTPYTTRVRGQVTDGRFAGTAEVPGEGVFDMRAVRSATPGR